MAANGFLRSVLLGAAVFVLVPCALARQNGQNGSDVINKNATNNSNGGNQSTSSRNGTSGSGTSSDMQSPPARQSLLYISGVVVTDRGEPPPPGVVVERVCGSKAMKEAYVGPDGTFGFQVGTTSDVLPDASDGDMTAGRWDPYLPPFGIVAGTGIATLSGLSSCDLRAQFGGYRSSKVPLIINQTVGNLDVGVIVIYPVERVPGTTVSVTSLAAPKRAKEDLAWAEKAVRNKKPDEAEKDLLAAVDVYPQYAIAWLELGRIYDQSHRVEDARNAFSKAMSADENFVNPYVELARLSAAESKWQEVADLSGRAVDLDPLDAPFGYYLNSLANFNLNNLDVAESSVRKFQRLDPTHRMPQSYLLLAGILHQKHDHAGELAGLRDYIKYAPQDDTARKVLARIHLMEKSSGGREPN